MIRSSRYALDPRRHDFQTKFGLVLTCFTLLLFGVLALLYGQQPDAESAATTLQQQQQQQDYDNNNNAANDDDTTTTTDFSSYSCHDLLVMAPNRGARQCAFARTCNNHDGIWAASIVFCGTWFSRGFLLTLLSPILVVWLVLLFRMLGSTAEDYFSPALEMLAGKLKLPPRFAGVSLLALGNGAADVSATVSAVTNDPDHGYKLALGALTGAAMVIGAVVSALVVLVAQGLPCRGALVRDVAALGLAVLVVWRELATGLVTAETVTLFLTMYVVFVVLVLVADIYHRAVVLPRRQEVVAQRERQRQLQAESMLQQQEENRSGGTSAAAATTTTTTAAPLVLPRESKFSHVLTAFSNYDNPPESADVNAFAMMNGGGDGDVGVDSDLLAADGTPVMLHGAHGILRRPHQQPPNSPQPLRRLPLTDEVAAMGYNRLEEPDGIMRQQGVEEGSPPPQVAGISGGGPLSLSMRTMANNMMIMGSSNSSHHDDNVSASWMDAWEEGIQEVRRHVEALWDDVMYNGDLNVVSKYLLLLEFPVTLLRQATVPLPCEGYYNRGITALSCALSPLWMAYYLHRGHEVSIWENSVGFFLYWILCVIMAAFLLRTAPPTPSEPASLSIMPNLWVATPVALYGFCIAATWIDTVADELVGVLDFLGIVLKIPGPIVGLTILAWGNSMSDLSADLTMARKGLANMAMTACFAGPLFNILVGLGLGFSSLAAKTGQPTREVTVSPSAATGFLFISLNSLVILATGLGMGKGTIPKKYGYIALTLYSIYLITSICLQYSGKYKDT